MSQNGEVPRKRLTYGKGPRHEIETASGAPGFIEPDLTPTELDEAKRIYRALRGELLLVLDETTSNTSLPVERQDVAGVLQQWFELDEPDQSVSDAIEELQRKLNRHEYTGEEESFLNIRVQRAPDSLVLPGALAAKLDQRDQRIFPEGFMGTKRDEGCTGC